jgi:uncharacterized protein YdaL
VVSVSLRSRTAFALALLACAVLSACDGAPPPLDARAADPAPATPPRADPPAPPAPPPDTLVLYDTGGAWGWLGEAYAVQAGHLASRFGSWEARPVSEYRAGDLSRARATIYVGSTFDELLPEAFLDDVLAGERPVLWAADNVWQLAERDPAFLARFGFLPGFLDASRIGKVRYKGRELTRYAENPAGLLGIEALDPSRATVLASAVRKDGRELPWAVRSGALTYVAENPFTYVDESDRYLAFADLLFDLLAPETPERHRALVRIEDVTPIADPERLRALADVLSAEGSPFAVAVVPVHVDPHGAYTGGRPEVVRMRDAPEVADALRYMVARGGVLVLHGYTHQHGTDLNPYSGVTGDDFEFWTAHVDAENRVVYGGPVPDDSAEFASSRVRAGLDELAAAGLPAPAIFEYPHYAGSPVASRAIAPIVPTAWHRGLYVEGVLPGGAPEGPRIFQQLFPYVVTDVYGFRVLPENLGNYQPEAHNAGVPTRFVKDLVANARANLVVRDGFASFFFHPFFEPELLREIVRGIEDEGYTFVSAESL